MKFQTYAELRRENSDAPTAWAVFGPDDEVGTLNFLTPAHVVTAREEIIEGVVINLDLALDAFTPSLIPTRGAPVHHLFANNEFHRDEYLDGFYTQSSSQIDGFRHIGHPTLGFYQGSDGEEFHAGTPRLGVNRFAERGIVGRGVLVDVARYRASIGRPIDHAAAEVFPISDVADAAASQGVVFADGDILLLRTGWISHHAVERRQAGAASGEPFRASGLAASHETLEWLWDHRFSVVATDNFAVEAWPAPENSPLLSGAEQRGELERSNHSGLMHRVMIPLLGMVLGELWDLDALADLSAADDRWTCMVVASPLNLTGGAGSPANAVAIR